MYENLLNLIDVGVVYPPKMAILVEACHGSRSPQALVPAGLAVQESGLLSLLTDAVQRRGCALP